MNKDVGRSPASQGRAATASQPSREGVSGIAGIPNAEARFVAPWTPPERMWGGLARDMIMWLRFGPGEATPRALFQHLERLGREIPQWLRDESEMKALDHVPSKGTCAVLIYRAMLWDGRANYLTPSGHTADCEYHCEQYPHECTCGATPPAPGIEARQGGDANAAPSRSDDSPTGEAGDAQPSPGAPS